MKFLKHSAFTKQDTGLWPVEAALIFFFSFYVSLFHPSILFCLLFLFCCCFMGVIFISLVNFGSLVAFTFRKAVMAFGGHCPPLPIPLSGLGFLCFQRATSTIFNKAHSIFKGHRREFKDKSTRSCFTQFYRNSFEILSDDVIPSPADIQYILGGHSDTINWGHSVCCGLLPCSNVWTLSHSKAAHFPFAIFNSVYTETHQKAATVWMCRYLSTAWSSSPTRLVWFP